MRTPGAVTTCQEHGRHNASNNVYEVGVNLPESRRVRVSGCPACRVEKHKAAKNGGRFNWLQNYVTVLTK